MSDEDPIQRSLARHGADPHALVQILREVQTDLGWLSRETQQRIATGLGVPITRVESVVRFYSFFYDEPRGAYRLLVSDNVTDRMARSQALFAKLCAAFDVKPGEVSRDGLVSVALTSCTGMCDQGPGLLVNNIALPRLGEIPVDELVALVRARMPLSQWPACCSARGPNRAARSPPPSHADVRA